MNKKDIAAVRKEFKVHNDKLQLSHIFNVYVQKETGEIFHYEGQPFDLLEHDTQELFLTNCKKTLTGQVDAKLFELKWQRQEQNPLRINLVESLEVNEADVTTWQEHMLEVVRQFAQYKQYEFDTVYTFVRGEYRAPVRPRSVESEEGGNDEMYVSPFILCSLNKTTLPETTYVFDYIEKQFKASVNVDPVIHLTSPLMGFLFPTFPGGMANVNRMLYNCGKPNLLDPVFVDEVLHCEEVSTAKEDKDSFELIVSSVAGEQVNTDVVATMYEEIEQMLEATTEEDENDTLSFNYRDVEQLLKRSGIENVDTEELKSTYETVVSEQEELKATNILPKNVSIKSDSIKVTLKREDLHKVTYKNVRGKRMLMIELEDDCLIEGFQLETIEEKNRIES